MSWSQAQQPEDLHDQIIILVGSAIRLLCGEAGVFVVSPSAFDPLSSTPYVVYRLSEPGYMLLLKYAQAGRQPDGAHSLVIETLPAAPQLSIAEDLGLSEELNEGQETLECCSLLIHDHAGILGTLYYARVAGQRSCFEQGPGGALPLFIAHLASGMRSALRSQLLLKEQNRLAAIFQQSAEGILTVDMEQRIVDFNPAMERLTGWSESEVLGRPYYEVLCPCDRQGNALDTPAALFAQAFTSRSSTRRELVLAARDGQRFDALVTASGFSSSRGEAIGGMLHVRDITREREQEEQRSTFISVISHELQTPIAIIKGYAATLARDDAHFDSQQVRTRLQAIEEEADHLNRLVGNLLYASRIQAGGLHMDIVPLDLASLVRGVVQRFRVKSPDVAIRLELPQQLPAVMADRDRIEEVLQNLLENAVKYSPKKRLITVACRATSEEVVVRVSDTGMGIPLREQEHIFDRFHRVDNSATRSTQGAGLGLYICRAIVEAHGGSIWVESVLHSGSTFSFSLPREEKALVPMVVF